MKHPQLRRTSRRQTLLSAIVLFVFCAALARGVETTKTANTEPALDGDRVLTLDECLAMALQNNHRRPASQFAVAVAEAQHQQALSGYWPQLKLQAGYQRMDEAPNFLFPSTAMGVPAQTITTPASTAMITVPAGVLGPTAVQLPVSVPSQSITTSAQEFHVPAQDVKLMNPDSFVGSINLTWLLYDGGMRKGLNRQATGYVEAMKQEARRTDLEIADSVRRMYYGSILARQLRQLGADTLARMEATLNLTETMYQGGGGKVTKADYLDNKVMVETIRALVAQLEKNEAMARAALANTAGLPWQNSVTPKDNEIPYTPLTSDLPALVGNAYEFSPDWKRLEAGLSAREGAVQTARSGHSPKLALTGNLHKWWNGYDAGMATDINKEGWGIGLGMELPLFDGFLTRNKVAEARARLNQLKEQRFLLREGLGLQIKDLFLGLDAARKAHDATLAAMNAAIENRDLNIRAYQNELVETDKVIRAQLMEAMMCAQYYKNQYDHAAIQSQLTLVIGRELSRQIEGVR
ncbi:MAG: TolC family protein [Verrucomicrobia bacterium]|nr:TolC family protein [Verrucomicrobiota bacterium]